MHEVPLLGELDDVVDLKILAAASSAAINWYHAGLVKHLGVQPARATFPQAGHKLSHAIFRHKEGGGENIRPYLKKIGPFGLPAHVSDLRSIEQQMSVLVAPGKPLAHGRVIAEPLHATLPMPGEHNVQNSLSAIGPMMP